MPFPVRPPAVREKIRAGTGREGRGRVDARGTRLQAGKRALDPGRVHDVSQHHITSQVLQKDAVGERETHTHGEGEDGRDSTRTKVDGLTHSYISVGSPTK